MMRLLVAGAILLERTVIFFQVKTLALNIKNQEPRKAHSIDLYTIDYNML